jgi:hypothetical protein
MEAEMADLLDRKMINLYGAQHDKFDKIDVTNTSKKLKTSKSRKQSLPPTGA